MAVSSGSEHRRRGRFWGRLSRYDLVLTVIPLVMLVALAASVLFAVPFELAIAGGSALSLAVVVDALFLNPPTRTP